METIKSWGGASRIKLGTAAAADVVLVSAASNTNGLILQPCIIQLEGTLGAAFDLITTLYFGATITTNPPIWQKPIKGVAGTTFASFDFTILDRILIPSGNQLVLNFGITAGAGRVDAVIGYKLL